MKALLCHIQVFSYCYPDSVLSLGSKFSTLEIDSEDYASYIAKYPSMAIELHLDYFGRQTIRELRVVTETGTYLFDIANSEVLRNGKRVKKWNENANTKYLREMEHFLRFADGGENTNPIDHASKVMHLCEGEVPR